MKGTTLDSQDTKDAIKNSVDWRDAVKDLLNLWIQESRSFSSGEVASALRIHRPEFKFAVGSIGEMIRDMFHSREMDCCDDEFGQPIDFYQGLRIAQGLFPTRTPAGTEVYVYGSSDETIDKYEFEVYIPLPGEDLSDYPDPDAQAASVPAPPVGLVIKGRLAKSDIKATVWVDGRMMIPRAALEAAVYLGGSPMHGGDDVFVSQTSKEVVILTADPGSNSPEFKSYEVWSSGGRVVFKSNDKDNPYPAGEEFSCKVESGKIVVALKD